MRFNEHYDLVGQHAFLSASKHHWVNYSDDKLDQSFDKYLAAQTGTRLHALASELILMRVKLPRTKSTLNMYVNDAIGYRMAVEQPLYYSDNCFGTADAISYKKNLLRIFDYKSGSTPANIRQVWIYAAIFCLEYGYDPYKIDMDLRIYQNDDILGDAEPQDKVAGICNKIVTFDKRIEILKIGV